MWSTRNKLLKFFIINYLKLKCSNDSNSSDGSSNGGGETIGTVEFGIQYLSDSQKLVVDLLRIFDLQFKDNSSNLDIYCKCTLLPDKVSFQTKAIKRSTNPIFEEQFDFDYLDVAKMESRSLEISIHELDKLSTDDCIGVLSYKLNLSNIEPKKIFLKDLKPWIRTGEVCVVSVCGLVITYY